MATQKLDPTHDGQPQEQFTRSTEQSARLTMPRYEAPYIVSYTDQDILEKLGPALTGTGSRIL